MRHFFTSTTLILLQGCTSQSTILTFKEPYKIPTSTPVVAAHPLTNLTVSEDVDTIQLPELPAQSMWTASGKFSVKMIDQQAKRKAAVLTFCGNKTLKTITLF